MIEAPVVVVGAGGHARVLVDALAGIGATVLGCVAPAAPAWTGAAWLGDDEWLLSRGPSGILLVNAVGSVKSVSARGGVFERFSKNGFLFATVVHRAAIVAADVVLGEGTQVMAGAIVQTGARLGRDVLVNTGAQLDHDCVVGDHSHVAPGVVCSGSVTIGEHTHIGTGAVVIQGVTIGARALVGAGALVLRDVASDAVALGHPAREVVR
jgi:sugar O-acyltransferase (sialic acid O-acetyltransferase NeuD family)